MLFLLIAVIGCAEKANHDETKWHFVDVALEAGVQDRFDINQGTAAVDFNNDGWVDLYMAGPAKPGILFVNQKDGTFQAQETPGLTTQGNIGANAADYDNDGDVDLFITCGSSGGICTNRLFRNDGISPESGEVLFSDQTASAGLGDILAGNAGATWADINLDGHLDLFVPTRWLGIVLEAPDPPTYELEDQLYRNNGDGTFTNISKSAGVNSPTNSQGACIFDYDQDGWPDIAVPTVVGPNLMWRNNGDETFTRVELPSFEKPYIGWACVVEDFNHDGRQDIAFSSYYQSWLDDPNRSGLDIPDALMEQAKSGSVLLLNQGDGSFLDVSLSTGFTDLDNPKHLQGTMGFQVGDLDLDGQFEVFFGNGGRFEDSPEDNRMVTLSLQPNGSLLALDRSAHFNQPAPEGDNLPLPYPSYPYRTHGTVIFDMDNDHDMDLFIGNGGHKIYQAEPNQFFRNDSAGNGHWLQVTLQGTQDNLNGIGATIRVSDGARGEHSWQLYKRVSMSCGFNSTVPRRVMIGTGERAGPFYVTVDWPDGSTSTLTEVPANEALTVVQ